MAVEQWLAVFSNMDGETGVLVAVAFAVPWHWATRHPLPICFFGVAQGLGYLFCLHCFIPMSKPFGLVVYLAMAYKQGSIRIQGIAYQAPVPLALLSRCP